MSLSRWACSFLECFVMALLVVPVAAQQESTNPPQLAHRPAPSLETPGKMKIDVIVTGEDGQPVTGLTQKDFALLDNKKPQPIRSFRAVDGALGAGIKDPPVEVVLLVDVVNTPLRVVADVRNQIEGYLRRNGGQLTQPTSLAIFDDEGVRVLARPTRDGNQLADALNKAEATMQTVLLTTQTEPVRVTLSLNALERITEAANAKEGRTMLIWIGVGWPMLEEPGYKFFQREIAAQFDRVVTLSAMLRESRLTLYSIYPTDPATTDEPHVQHYRSFLRAASSVNNVRPGDLALPVLAIQSGGHALDAPGDVGDEIASCVADAKAYYTLGFDPRNGQRVDEYHELAVRLKQTHLKARTSAGYYAEPAFEFKLPALGGH